MTLDLIEARLRDMGVHLPDAPAPAGSYSPVVVSDQLAFVSGQIPLVDGVVVHTGAVDSHNADEARESAKICALNILAHLRRTLGGLECVSSVLKISGFVNSKPGFGGQPGVIDAASKLFFDAWGERGRHARAAVGVASLPLDAMTEIDAIVSLSPQ